MMAPTTRLEMIVMAALVLGAAQAWSSPRVSAPQPTNVPPYRTRMQPEVLQPEIRSTVTSVVSRIKGTSGVLLPYLGLGSISTGAALLASSVAGTPAGVLVAGCVAAPAAFLLTELLLFGGGRRVAQLMGGKPADKYLTSLVTEVANRAHMIPPAHVYEVPSDEPNAFAAGFSKRDSTVAVTSGLRHALDRAELQAVIAHEMGHIHAADMSKNMHLATVFAGLGGFYEAGRLLMRTKGDKVRGKKEGDGGSKAIGVALMAGGVAARLGGDLIRCASSRRAEFGADSFGAKLYGASAMTSALQKIEYLSKRRRSSDSDLLRARAGVFSHAYISSSTPTPRRSTTGWLQRLLRAFDTHPTLEERVEALKATR